MTANHFCDKHSAQLPGPSPNVDQDLTPEVEQSPPPSQSTSSVYLYLALSPQMDPQSVLCNSSRTCGYP